MPRFSRVPFGAAVRLLCLTILSAVMVGGATATAQEPAPSAPAALPECSMLDTLGVPMQMNLRASAAMVACGRAVAGDPREISRSEQTLVGGNVDVTPDGPGGYPHVTQSEHQIWVNGTTVVVNYNDSRDAANGQSSGMSYSIDGGATFVRPSVSPFASGHGNNYGDPNVVFNKKLNLWFAADLTSGCGGQGIGLWTSPNGISWSTGVCAHTGTDDDRNSMWVDNNAASPFYGRVYISWNDFSNPNGNLTVTYSDNGTTWTPVTVYSAAFRRDVQISVAPNGTVLLAAMDEGGGGSANRQNLMFRSTNGGVTWSPPVSLGAPFAPPCDFNDGYFRVCTPIWRHMGWGDLATGANGVVVYSYATGGVSSGGGRYVAAKRRFRNWEFHVVDGRWQPSSPDCLERRQAQRHLFSTSGSVGERHD